MNGRRARALRAKAFRRYQFTPGPSMTTTIGRGMLWGRSIAWERGTFRRIYQDVKREYKRARAAGIAH